MENECQLSNFESQNDFDSVNSILFGVESDEKVLSLETNRIVKEKLSNFIENYTKNAMEKANVEKLLKLIENLELFKNYALNDPIVAELVQTIALAGQQILTKTELGTGEENFNEIDQKVELILFFPIKINLIN